jgi:hypothetical protein
MKKTMLRIAAVLLPAVAMIAPMSQGAQASGPGTKHFIANRAGSTAPAALGYNLFDTGSNVQLVNSLPSGVQALVWLGQKCPTPIDDTFKSKVNALVGNPRVYGYYISDEPHASSCPGAAAALASRADYISAKTGGAQKSFIVLSRIEDYSAFNPSKSHVDLIGLDPYPCSISNPTCDLSKIGEKLRAALAAGIPSSAVVPVFQTFGQEGTLSHYYNLPTASQLQAMLNEWDRLLPSPAMDYSYGWAHQSSSNPTLVDSPALQGVMKKHNTGVA